MSKGKVYLGICIALLSGMTSTALVQAQATQPPSDRIIQLEQQRQAEERRRIEAEQRNRSEYPVPFEERQSAESLDGPCFTIQQIELQGVNQLPLSEFDETLTSFVGQCLGVGQLNEVLTAVTRRYFELGYITTRAYLPQQNLQQGTLIIQVIEGLVEAIESAANRQASENLAIIFPGLEQQILNLRDLEQGLEQINRLRSRRATMQLIPGSAMGQSLVEIQEQTAQPWQITSRFSNSGQDNTGESQAQLMASWDSPLGLYDYTYLSLQTDTKDDSDGKKSQSVSWHWDIPLGYWNLSLDTTYFEYLSRVQGTNQTFETSGKSQTQRLSIGRVLSRDADSKTRLNLGLTRKENENFIEDVLIETSSRTLGIATLALKHEQYFQRGGLLLGELTYHRGLDAFSSPDDDEINSQLRHLAPKAQFDKYTIDIDFNQPFSLAAFSNKLQYKTRLHAQYSPDVLFGSEEISIGSAYTVRGYKESSLSSNTGAYWRNDLLASFYPAWGKDWLQRVTPFIGLDAGLVRDYSTDTDKYETLKGWAVGLMATGKYWSIEMTYAQPIDEPDYLRNTGEEFAFSISFTL
ncbi:ShlB/FhaC/HecB family hemolysin secretion/activation protein [Maricurvus nonylphenolicus]|uniref:ShlB/FhaC/HecB family hemolysin secretion/activation protein n=1 Tax=Maricurvus nonylphenolicus TaxID=1008307 RepID=UPI0036F32ADC